MDLLLIRQRWHCTRFGSSHELIASRLRRSERDMARDISGLPTDNNRHSAMMMIVVVTIVRMRMKMIVMRLMW